MHPKKIILLLTIYLAMVSNLFSYQIKYWGQAQERIIYKTNSGGSWMSTYVVYGISKISNNDYNKGTYYVTEMELYTADSFTSISKVIFRSQKLDYNKHRSNPYLLMLYTGDINVSVDNNRNYNDGYMIDQWYRNGNDGWKGVKIMRRNIYAEGNSYYHRKIGDGQLFLKTYWKNSEINEKQVVGHFSKNQLLNVSNVYDKR